MFAVLDVLASNVFMHSQFFRSSQTFLRCKIFFNNSDNKTGRLVQFYGTSLSVREVWGSIPGPVKSNTVSPTARHRVDVSSELCYPSAETRRWAPPIVPLFGVISRV